MKEKVKLIITISVGPPGSGNKIDDVIDTIRSAMYYGGADSRIVIQDNSHPLNTGKKLQEMFPQLDMVRSPRNYGLYGGLYKAESIAMQHAYERYEFGALLRMDSDALMIGHGFADEAIAKISANPNAGVLGMYFTSGEGIEWARQQLLAMTSVTGYIKDPRRCAFLRQLIYKAERNNWQLGQHILGGALVMTPTYIERVNKAGLLHREELRRAKLQNDHTYSLLCKAVALDLIDFNVPNGPMAITWRGLPASPQDLIEQGAKVVHSTRFWKNMDEAQVRTFFRARRESGK
ncbi:MAG: hypothetical protein KF716_31940 [Anaerolineae bacterium]|nr:hypothetical protein [Anaerolineae bacterium]